MTESVRKTIDIEAPVREATLTEDRARVGRRAVVDLPAGDLTLRVAGVAPVLVDKTLQAKIEASEGCETQGAKVFDVRSRRERLVRSEARPEELAALDQEAERLRDEEVKLAAKIRLLSRQAEVAGQAMTTTIGEMAEDASFGVAAVDEWAEGWRGLAERERELRAQVREHSLEWQDVKERSRRLAARREAAAHPGGELRASLEIDLTVAVAGTYGLRIDYIVPGACWRPYHRATLIEDGEEGTELAFECEACVWQRTGEDWDEVSLSFSTQRSSLGVEPPLLVSDVLRVKRKSEAVVVETREQEVHTAGLGGGPTAVIPEVPGIDDGGVPLTLKATREATIPSDGQPYRAPIFRFETPVETELVVVAEAEPAAVFKTMGRNESALPVLAGPVDLIRRGGLVGRATVLFVSPGERFALGWGPDGEVRVFREVEDQEEERSMLSAWITQAHLIKVKLSNIGAREKVLTVRERVPVSEIEKVKVTVDLDQTTAERTPDRNGFLEWEVALPPFTTDQIDLRYTIKRRREVVGV